MSTPESPSDEIQRRLFPSTREFVSQHWTQVRRIITPKRGRTERRKEGRKESALVSQHFQQLCLYFSNCVTSAEMETEKRNRWMTWRHFPTSQRRRRNGKTSCVQKFSKVLFFCGKLLFSVCWSWLRVSTPADKHHPLLMGWWKLPLKCSSVQKTKF